MFRTRASVHHANRHGSFLTTLSDCRNARFILLYCASGLAVFGYTIPFIYSASYATNVLHASNFVAALSSSILALGATVGRLCLGYLADTKLGTMNVISSAMGLGGLLQWILWAPASNSVALFFIFCFFCKSAPSIKPVKIHFELRRVHGRRLHRNLPNSLIEGL